MEFDCDVEGDGEEGWEDDLDDQTDQEGAPQLPEGDGEINDEDLDGPGKAIPETWKIFPDGDAC